ncbi:isopeptide-forming domain-containing fimbrial protein [Listeria floridensis]|uniref:isopeptide-forming domain-containing fimbrial protein n=1 Tax=Listeria floridensis TaxID=1494962 RepID=UPI0004B46BBD|nr:isopeptide-forming domain-containing fimbrial protein [Listeria floridensis]
MTDLQGRKNKKRVFKAGIAGVMLVSALYLPYNAFADPILNAPNTSVPGANDVASAEYEFVADFNKAETEVIPFGGEWTEMANLAGRSKDWYAIKPTDAQKGKIGVKYTNVGRYQGEEIDLVITINDFESFNANQGYIAYSKTSIGHITQQYNWVDQTWHFVKHGTNTPIQVSGYMTINDIDYLQQFTFSKETAAAVDQILVPVANSKVEYDANGGAWKFYAPSAYSSNDYDEDAMFTFLYSDASELRFRWGRDNRDLTVASKPNDEVVAGDYFGYLAKKPLRTETLVPVKQVSDSDETAAESNNLQNVSETFTYDIFHTVPDEWAEFYYASYRFTDTLADVLDVKSVKVFNEEGTDVTSWFTNDSNGNQIVLNAKPEVLQTASFIAILITIKSKQPLKQEPI